MGLHWMTNGFFLDRIVLWKNITIMVRVDALVFWNTTDSRIVSSQLAWVATSTLSILQNSNAYETMLHETAFVYFLKVRFAPS
jgi:hypothetical protein